MSATEFQEIHVTLTNEAMKTLEWLRDLCGFRGYSATVEEIVRMVPDLLHCFAYIMGETEKGRKDTFKVILEKDTIFQFINMFTIAIARIGAPYYRNLKNKGRLGLRSL